MLKGLVQDIRYAARVMLKSRGLTFVAVATLALGIGANTAIFSVINALLLRPLPYPEPDRLVMVWQDLRARGGPATEWTGPSQQFDWKAETEVFESLTSIRGWNARVGGGDLPETFNGEQTTFEYFDVLGARRRWAGRSARPTTCRTRRGSSCSAIASGRVGSAATVGRWTHRSQINGENHEIIGVMPRRLHQCVRDGRGVVAPAATESGQPVAQLGRSTTPSAGSPPA